MILSLSVPGFAEELSVEAPKISKCPSQPELRLLSPTQEDLHNIQHLAESDALLIGQSVNITLECRSSKPIDFDFEGPLVRQ